MELIKKWIAALRSGKYQQGFMFLRRNNKYCVNGVLCEIASIQYEKILHGVYIYKGNKCILPPELGHLITKFGLSEEDLSIKNDIGWPFTKLADYIEYRVKCNS